MNKDDNKIVLSKSSRFPSISLDYAIQVITEASKFGKYITNTHIAGNGSVKGGAFDRKKASLGYYGLIQGRGVDLHITNLAEKILNPLNDSEKTQAIQNAFLSPELFKKLYQTTSKRTPIKVSFLGNLLVREYAVQPSAKNEFLSTFIKSGIYANLIKYFNDNKEEILFLEQPEDRSKNENKASPDSAPQDFFDQFFQPAKQPIEQIQTVELILTHGKGKISVPKDLTPIDARKLKAQIDILASIFDDSGSS